MNPDEGARHDIDATAVLINEAAGSFVSGKRRISWLELHCLGDARKPTPVFTRISPRTGRTSATCAAATHVAMIVASVAEKATDKTFIAGSTLAHMRPQPASGQTAELVRSHNQQHCLCHCCCRTAAARAVYAHELCCAKWPTSAVRTR